MVSMRMGQGVGTDGMPLQNRSQVGGRPANSGVNQQVADQVSIDAVAPQQRELFYAGRDVSDGGKRHDRTVLVRYGEMPQVQSPVASAVLDSPAAIAVLLDGRQRAAFRPFVGRERSVSQAAHEAGETLNTTLSRVKRWQRLGLLSETRRVAHRRGSMALYRSSAEAYFIPYASTPAAELLALAEEVYLPQMQSLLKAFVRSGEQLSGEWGVRFEGRGAEWSARPVTSAVYVCEPTDDEAPPSLLEWSELSLTAEDAKALQRDLMAVLIRYQAKETPHAPRHALMLGLA